jgi:hypothetical protein
MGRGPLGVAAVVVGVLLALFGVLGIAIQMTEGAGQTMHGIVMKRYLQDVAAARTRYEPASVKTVTIRLENGEEEDVESNELYDAVGDDSAGAPVTAVVEPGGGPIDSVEFEGQTFGSGASAAGIVATIVCALLGLGLVWLGFRRGRSA